MRPDQIKCWQKQAGMKRDLSSPKPIYLNGVTVATSNLKNALLSLQSRDKRKQPVLFIYMVQNYKKYNGFRLNNDKFALDASKEEVLLQEGCPVHILKIERITVCN